MYERWSRGLAIKAKRLLNDVGHAREFVVGSAEETFHFGWHLGIMTCEVDEVHHGFERIVDLVSNGCSHSADAGKLFAGEKSFFGLLALGNIAGNLGGPDDASLLVANRRDGDGNVEELSSLGSANGFEVFNSTAVLKGFEKLELPVRAVHGE